MEDVLKLTLTKDQVWLFHSIKLAELNPIDLRYKLVEYYLNWQKYQEIFYDCQNYNKEIFDSQFEIDVFMEICKRGYKVIPQYRIRNFRIDMVIDGDSDSLAVECDGDRFHGIDRFQQDIARQSFLERLGIKFWRIRASNFYRDKEKALEELWKVLNDLSIKPKTEDDFIDEVQMDSQNDKYDENIHPSNTKKWSVKEEEKKLVIQDSVESPDKEPIEEKINLETEQEIQPKPMAVFKCEKCKNFDRYLILKDDIVYFECVECKNLKMYPKRMQNVATNIKCSKCDEKYVIRYNFYSGPYLYCKSCDLSALIRFYLK